MPAFMRVNPIIDWEYGQAHLAYYIHPLTVHPFTVHIYLLYIHLLYTSTYCTSHVLHTCHLLHTSYVLYATYSLYILRIAHILLTQYTCAQVWELLRGWRLPFCALYERGYTSLGKRSRTHRNLALRRSDGTFAPAWELRDGSLERAGREAAANDAPSADPNDGPIEAPRRLTITLAHKSSSAQQHHTK